MLNKAAIKHILGELPLTAEVYWSLRQPGQPVSGNFSLKRLERRLPQWIAELKPFAVKHTSAFTAGEPAPGGRKILIFATLRYWIEHAVLLGLGLAGLGHKVWLAYLPYENWKQPFNRFDLRRQSAYTLGVLSQASPYLQSVPLANVKKMPALPSPLAGSIAENALRDTQYSLQVEDVDIDSPLYRMRLERDTEAARATLGWIQEHRPDVVIIPNGSILEFGAVFAAVRYLDQNHFSLPVVTYEFGEQRGRIWLARNAEVMHQDTDALWGARKESSLSGEQLQQVRGLFAARQHGSLWENFARRWQGVPSAGGEKARQILGLDAPGPAARPVVLLATNVIGDSLTLGRQVFSTSMTEWLARTIRYFAQRHDVQFVVRVHPGELITKGPSVSDLISSVLSQLDTDFSHIHLVPADAQVNTYDIVEIADLGLVYTTTVGMEMAMSGVPAIVIGRTHYRCKGFTLDPDSWDAYFTLLDQVLSDPKEYRLNEKQVKSAWAYAYRFYFEYPQPFPWHLLHFWKDQEEWSLPRVLGEEGQASYSGTFRALAGEPVNYG